MSEPAPEPEVEQDPELTESCEPPEDPPGFNIGEVDVESARRLLRRR